MGHDGLRNTVLCRQYSKPDGDVGCSAGASALCTPQVAISASRPLRAWTLAYLQPQQTCAALAVLARLPTSWTLWHLLMWALLVGKMFSLLCKTMQPHKDASHGIRGCALRIDTCGSLCGRQGALARRPGGHLCLRARQHHVCCCCMPCLCAGPNPWLMLLSKSWLPLQVDLCVMALRAMPVLPCLAPLPQLKPGLMLTSINGVVGR